MAWTKIVCLVALVAIPAMAAGASPATQKDKTMTIGAYYFGGWAGSHALAANEKEPWARNAPTHLTRRMVEEFPERQPVWGWRDDSLEIMERQIDLAADHGLAFFAFCWYWHDNGKAINPDGIRQDPKHLGLELFLKARNSQRMKFCLLIANHQGFEITGAENWKAAGEVWLPYLKHPQHVTVDGKPLLLIFNSSGGDKAGFANVQEAARKAGLPGVAIAACGGGAIETGYTHSTRYNVVPGYAAGSAGHKYAELVDANRRVWGGRRDQPCIPTVTAGWDKRPWEGPTGLNQVAGWYYPDRTPEQFAGFLRDAIAWMDKHPEQTTAERLVLIYAWNEFGEGGYLAPTKGDPDGQYLKALRSVVMPTSQPGVPAGAKTPASQPQGEFRVGRLKVNKVLFLGNSITRHGPKADIGWTGDWGMAATSEDKDYVHLLGRQLARVAGAAPQVRVGTLVELERGFDKYDVADGLRDHVAFKADVVIVALGENVPDLGTPQAKAGYRAAFARLLAELKKDNHPAIFVRSSFWPNAAKDEIMKAVSAEAGGVFVDIAALAAENANYARSERKIDHAGVGTHPGGRGMQAIADAIWTAITKQGETTTQRD